MRRGLAVIIAWRMLIVAEAHADDPFPATSQQIPADWTGAVFKPSFSFPTDAPAEALPWEHINFMTDPGGYMAAVMTYVREGMDTVTWDVGANPVRKWYHVPWMHVGPNGREFIHGLTKERPSRKGELGERQGECRQNWAVGFCNPAGGGVLNKVWGDGTKAPVISAVAFPVGTVVAKLLFTEATKDDNDILVGAPEWQANIYTGTAKGRDGCLLANATRNPFSPRSLRLLQFDIAVRDKTANAKTGWVFGTFVYNGKNAAADPWDRLEPVGLMWGNDPDLSDEDVKKGEKPKESVILKKFDFARDFGRGGRMNGPVDNPNSACLSCHMTAQHPALSDIVPPDRPNAPAKWSDAVCWFLNLGPDVAFGKPPPDCGALTSKSVSLDFSLQLAKGLQNYFAARQSGNSEASLPKDSPAIVDGVLIYPINRDGF